MKHLFHKTVLVCILFSALTAHAQNAISSIQSRWAEIKYTLTPDQQAKAYEALATKSQHALRDNPKAAEHWVWHGIILSSWAGAKGGLGALRLVKEAKAALEHAISLDETALAGAAYTSLGALYYQVPGWPIGFGDKKKAQTFLEQGLAINPDGIDSNFFYGDFLANQHQYTKAKAVLQHALEATPRSQRPLADQGRRAEIKQLLDGIEHP